MEQEKILLDIEYKFIEDFIKLRIILNTGDNYSISFKNKTHPSYTHYTYD